MKKSVQKGLLLLLMLPYIAFADTEGDSMLTFAIIWVVFETLHWSFGIFIPISKWFEEKKGIKGVFWFLFIVRALVLMVIIPIHPDAFVFDFFSLFLSIFVMSIVTGLFAVSKGVESMNTTIITENYGKIVCPKCGKEMAYGNSRCSFCGTPLNTQTRICDACKTVNLITAKFCKSCGKELPAPIVTVRSGDKLFNPVQCPNCNATLLEAAKFCKYCGQDVQKVMGNVLDPLPKANVGNPVNRMAIDTKLLAGSEEQAIGYMVEKEMNLDSNNKGKTLPTIEKKKTLMTLIYMVIVFILLSIYMAYHTYQTLGIVLLIIATIIYLKVISGYSLKKYITTEIQKRPDEKINYVVSSILSGATTSKATYKLIRLIIIIAFVGSFIILFNKPHLIYEHYAGGYAVRYYTYGLSSNSKEIKIPATHNNKNVIAIRGDVFKNVTTIEKVVLPNTIQEIRGGAFQNCTSLKEINLPEGLDQIHGDTFNGCTSLYSIHIPEGVTRIGGSAFRDCYNLQEVTIPSTVSEIGSSAFRNTGISRVCISNSTYVNERAFKGTYPTIVYYENNCE